MAGKEPLLKGKNIFGRIGALLLILAMTFASFAQDVHFSQFWMTPLLLNLTGVQRLSRGLALAGAMEDHPSEPHYYLAFVAVAPNRQRHGLGSALLEESLVRVDRAGAPAYLENSNPRNLKLYEGLGFRVVKEVRARPEAPPLFAMWRPGRKGSGIRDQKRT